MRGLFILMLTVAGLVGCGNRGVDRLTDGGSIKPPAPTCYTRYTGDGYAFMMCREKE